MQLRVLTDPREAFLREVLPQRWLPRYDVEPDGAYLNVHGDCRIFEEVPHTVTLMDRQVSANDAEKLLVYVARCLHYEELEPHFKNHAITPWAMIDCKGVEIIVGNPEFVGRIVSVDQSEDREGIMVVSSMGIVRLLGGNLPPCRTVWDAILEDAV